LVNIYYILNTISRFNANHLSIQKAHHDTQTQNDTLHESKKDLELYTQLISISQIL